METCCINWCVFMLRWIFFSHNNLQRLQFFRPVRIVSCRFLQQGHCSISAKHRDAFSYPHQQLHCSVGAYTAAISRLLLRDLSRGGLIAKYDCSNWRNESSPALLSVWAVKQLIQNFSGQSCKKKSTWKTMT